MRLEIEFLDEALEEAEAAARWYAERSESAALGFADEIDFALDLDARLLLLVRGVHDDESGQTQP